jgi:hypothetical protein
VRVLLAVGPSRALPQTLDGKPSTMEWVHSYAALYPLVGSGALFMMVMGAAVMLGSIWPRSRNLSLALGAMLAVAATSLAAARLAAPYGVPTATQVTWLFGAVVVEVVALIYVIREFAPRGERPLFLAILVVVGLHFLPMAPAFGPLAVVLGVACTANALVAARVPSYSLRAMWAIDGGLKITIAVLMWSLLFVAN